MYVTRLVHTRDTSHSRVRDRTRSHKRKLQVLGRFGFLLATYM